MMVVLLCTMQRKMPILGNEIVFVSFFLQILFFFYYENSQVCLLLKRGADLSTLNEADEDALSIAIGNANADIVTL